MGNIRNLRPPWQRGQSGNPGGRARGRRSRFSEAFLRDFCASWEKNGVAVIERVIAEDPVAYVRIGAALVSKFDIDVDQPEELTRERIQRAIRILEEIERRAANGGSSSAGNGTGEPGTTGELPPATQAPVGTDPEMASVGAGDGAADGRR